MLTTAASAKPALRGHHLRSISCWHRRPSSKSQHRIAKARPLEALHRRPAAEADAAGPGWRLCSSWGRPGRRWTDREDQSRTSKREDGKSSGDGERADPFELSPRERFWRQRMEIFRKRVEEDPYSALFGRSLDRLAGVYPRSIWDSPLIPKWVREELGLDSKPETNKGPENPKKSQEKPGSTDTKAARQPAAQSAPPVLEYDPISNRMVLARARSAAASPQPEPPNKHERFSKAGKNEAVEIPVKPFRPKQQTLVVAQSSLRASERSPTVSAEQPVDSLAAALAEYDKRDSATPAQQPVDPVAAALSEYDDRVTSQPAKPHAPQEEFPVQEGLTDQPQKSPAVSLKAKDVLAAVKADVEEAYAKAFGLQAKPQRPSLPRDDIDLLRSSDVRAGMGIPKRPVTENTQQKEERRSRLEKNFAEVHKEDVSDVKDMRTRPQAHGAKRAADTEAAARQSTPREVESSQAHDVYPYSETTERMMTALSRHRTTSTKLETALTRMNEGKSKQDRPQTPVSQEPNQAHSVSSVVADPGHGKTAQGLTSPMTSAVDRPSHGTKIVQDSQAGSESAAPLAQVDSTDKKPQSVEGYPARERAAVRKLEDEVQAQKAAMQAMEEDGYSRQPMGLETSYAREMEACKNGGRTLEQELSQMNGDVARTAAREAAAGEERVAMEAAARREQKARDVALVREVRKIYEDHYGVIDTKHRQGRPVRDEFEGRVDDKVHKCLDELEQSKRNTYLFTPDGLEAELSSQQQQHTTAPPTMPAARDLSSRTTGAPSSAAKESPASPSGATASSPAVAAPAQMEPIHEQRASAATVGAARANGDGLPVLPAQSTTYKLLAFDPATGGVVSATTTSFAGDASESVLPVATIMTQLSTPEKFIPHINALHEAGFQPVSSTSSMLVFKQVSQPSKTTAPAAPSTASPVNPIDGMGRATLPPPQTGNFASPTGFVNHDVPPPPYSPPPSHEHPVPPPPPPPPSPAPGPAAAAPRAVPPGPGPAAPATGAANPTIVRRTEPVFSGWANAGRRGLRQRLKERRRERRAWGRAARRAASVLATGAVFASGAYAVGVVQGLRKDA